MHLSVLRQGKVGAAQLAVSEAKAVVKADVAGAQLHCLGIVVNRGPVVSSGRALEPLVRTGRRRSALFARSRPTREKCESENDCHCETTRR